MRTPLPPWISTKSMLIVLTVGVIALVVALFGFGSEIIGSICQDGWLSDSTGTGTCSYHDGVADDRTTNTLIGQRPGDWVGVVRWPLLAVGVVCSAAGLAGLAFTRRSISPSFAGPYLDLHVRIAPNDNGYTVETRTPTGQSTQSLHTNSLPRDRGLELLHAYNTSPNQRRVGTSQNRAIEQFGAQLFDAIFDSQAEAIYRNAIDNVRTNGAALRISLTLHETIADIPWEYLYDSKRATYLALSRETSLVRMAETLHLTRPHPPIDTLRILIMGAAPRAAGPLDIAAEHELIRSALRPSEQAGRVEMRRVEGGSQDALRAALSDFAPHIFHFSGHGQWNEELDDGVILFEDRGGYGQPASGRDLGVLLNGTSVRLAIFNSCDAARSSKDDRFAGISSSLVAQGVPAAIGMQFRFDDSAAATFGSTLLQQLTHGETIDVALFSARSAVFSLSGDIGWATPVLTSRVAIGEVLPRAGSDHELAPLANSTDPQV